MQEARNLGSMPLYPVYSKLNYIIKNNWPTKSPSKKERKKRPTETA